MVTITRPRVTFDGLRYRPRQRSLRWMERYIFEPNELRPFNSLLYPHIGAPGGPCDMLDDPWVLEIWLQWASRLGKTMFAQSAMLFFADANPSPGLFASSSQRLAIEVTNRTYRMLAQCKPLRKQMRPSHLRKQDLIDLDECRIFVAWARSVTTLSDKGVRFGHANEIDKWERTSTSTEADPLKLWDDRFKEYSTHKKIKEGTPSVMGVSRIERGRLAGTNCSYWVPCPHCGTYQILDFGERGGTVGVRWDKLSTGKSDTSLALQTGHYACVEGCRIESHERHAMMRAGVWVPEGCGVDPNGAADAVARWQEIEGICWQGWDKAPWITGEPARSVRSASYQLSSLYALAGITWGGIAEEFLQCKSHPGDLQNFVNQWLGKTWERIARKQTWEKLGDRLIVGTKRSLVPEWASVVTLGVDRQIDRFVYTVDAWGPDRTNHTLEYGEVDELADLRNIIERHYEYEDGQGIIQPAATFIDSGFRPQGVYEFCREMIQKGTPVYPCKGSSVALEADVKWSVLGKNTSMPGLRLFSVDSIRTQSWIDNVLHVLTPEDAGGSSVYCGSRLDHQDFLEQLLNDASVVRIDNTNNAREVYERIDSNVPNDFRDCKRYAYVAMVIATRNRKIRPRGEKPKRRSAIISTGEVN